MKYEVMGQHTAPKGNIIRDQRIKLSIEKSFGDYPQELRLVEAKVIVDGKEKLMTFISNNFEWAAQSIADLYKSRWAVEVFFKEMKQNLQLADFLGHNENAVRWQIWTALLTYVILRFISYQSKWKASFTRLFTVIRGVMWSRIDLYSVLKFCGTAKHKKRMVAVPQQLYLPGFKSIRYGTIVSKNKIFINKIEKNLSTD